MKQISEKEEKKETFIQDLLSSSPKGPEITGCLECVRVCPAGAFLPR
jgi:ferredoxin